MKTIGIKLADGSFYPVLEEGIPSEKQLDLTTAHNNQTKIVVDLYRSTNCTMDDAEYVDSLLIENMNEHPSEEPVITFQVSIDENNELSAKIIDPETGNQSDTTITLLSRTIEERLVTDEYNISDTIVNDPSDEEETPAKEVTGAGLLAAANAINEREEITEDDFTLGDPEANESMDFDFPEVTEEAPVETEETAVTEEEVTGSFDALDDFENIAEDKTEDINIEQGNLEEDQFELSEDTSEFVEDTNFDLEDNSLPNFEFGNDETLEATTFEATNDEITSSEEIAPEEDYSLPDFDDIPDPTESTDTTESFDSMDFNNFNMDDDLFSDTPTETAASNGSGISFTGLYDTDQFDSESESEEDEVKKKTRVPVIICIVCAIICVIATLLILFIIPSKYNLITKKAKKEPVPVEEVIEVPVIEPEPIPEPEPEPIPEPEPEPEPIPEAVEDEVIVIEKAEEVVPLPPPVVEEIKPKNITYKIRWGDTLWDIANTYYKNPWRYKYIARYNGIKDPDYIISGTYIIIPAE